MFMFIHSQVVGDLTRGPKVPWWHPETWSLSPEHSWVTNGWRGKFFPTDPIEETQVSCLDLPSSSLYDRWWKDSAKWILMIILLPFHIFLRLCQFCNREVLVPCQAFNVGSLVGEMSLWECRWWHQKRPDNLSQEFEPRQKASVGDDASELNTCRGFHWNVTSTCKLLCWSY